ncbi:hypothetical protein GCM10009840_18170 [Pseudolysinimonas kribbensis]|uniref:Uncharacterized protein n=1 Tax=Pseudolysinimonas kribbensis TaxID=433641 RepID=A0ABQ6K2L4_9MICO|nr:hypothetical protein GCM10025881_06240 [Pseudolysinimonas kribbensis]
MLRKRVPEENGTVPFELLDRSDLVWDSLRATSEWLRLHGLSTPKDLSMGPATRFEAACDAFAISQGWFKTYGTPYKSPDWNKLREAGVPRFGRPNSHDEKWSWMR